MSCIKQRNFFKVFFSESPTLKECRRKVKVINTNVLTFFKWENYNCCVKNSINPYGDTKDD